MVRRSLNHLACKVLTELQGQAASGLGNGPPGAPGQDDQKKGDKKVRILHLPRVGSMKLTLK